jgi:hypothetical protein
MIAIAIISVRRLVDLPDMVMGSALIFIQQQL